MATKENIVDILLQVVEGAAKLTAKELGLIKADPKATARFAKCLQCPFLKQGECTHCNCDMKAKVLVNRASCPIGKW